jgi:WD40 repeat protein
MLGLNSTGVVEPAMAQSTEQRLDRLGDPLPRRTVHRFGTSRFRHGGGARVSPQALSPDGRTVAVLTPRGCRLFDLKSGKEEGFCPFPPGVAYQELATLAFSPDGKSLAMVQVMEGDCVIWDSATGRMLRRLYGFVRRWMDLEMTNPQEAENAKLVVGLGFTEDAKSMMAWTLEEKVCFLDLAADQVSPEREIDGYHLLNVSGDRTTLLGISAKTKQVQVLDTSTGKPKGVIEADIQSDKAGLSPDGKLVAVLTPDGVQTFESTGKALRTLPGKVAATSGEDQVADFVFTPDGKFLLAPTGRGQILRWDLSSGKQLSPLGSPMETDVQVHPHPDGKTIVSLSWDGLIRRRDVETGEEQTSGDGYVGDVRAIFSPDGANMIVTDEAGRFDAWDVRSGKQLDSLAGKERRPTYVDIAKDGKTAVVHTSDGLVSIRELPSWKEKHAFRLKDELLLNKKSGSRAVTVSSDGGWVFLSGLIFGTALFDATTGKEVWRRGSQEKCAFSRDGSTVFVANADEASCLETATGKVQWQYSYTMNDHPWTSDLAHSGTAAGIDLSPDGRRLAVALHDGTIRLIDAATGKETSQLPVQEAGVRWNVSFSSDGRWLLYPGHNGEPRILDAATREELYRLAPSHESWETHFHPGGRHALSVQANNTVLLWDLRPDEIPAAKDDPEQIWQALASRGGVTAYRAIWSLVDDPATAVELLKRKLSPTPPPLARDVVLKLVATLNDDDFATREQVSKQLIAEGKDILPLLQEALKNSHLLEQRRRLEEVMGHITSGPSTPEEWRILRAVQALEMGGSAQGRKLLQTWTNGRKGALLTEQAREAVARKAE